jgi:hypothetical protein
MAFLPRQVGPYTVSREHFDILDDLDESSSAKVDFARDRRTGFLFALQSFQSGTFSRQSPNIFLAAISSAFSTAVPI